MGQEGNGLHHKEMKSPDAFENCVNGAFVDFRFLFKSM